MDKIHLVIVDDHPLFREGVAAILGKEPRLEIVGQGASADEAIRLASELLPDIIMLDISMPGGGLYAAKTIVENCPVVKIIMLTASDNEDDVLTALKSGAKAYILKGVATRELLGILLAVQAGEGYVTPSLAANILSELRLKEDGGRHHKQVSVVNKLTDREQEILELVAMGISNKEIGQQLQLTEKTVKHHVSNILQKLQVQNRVQAALLLAQKNPPTRE